MEVPVLGILGGGQLGRMMVEAAHRLCIKTIVLDPKGKESPAGLISDKAIKGSFQDGTDIISLSKQCDVITTEIEHIDTESLLRLEGEGQRIEPSPLTIQLIQDKFAQKQFVQSLGVASPRFVEIKNKEDATSAGKILGYPYVLKRRFMAYDGKGNSTVESEKDIEACMASLNDNRLYAEEYVPWKKELAVMVVRGEDGIVSYDVVETSQEYHICHTVVAPARITPESHKEVRDMSVKIVKALNGYGIFGIELFLVANANDNNGKPCFLFNEIAPRPHNSGHFTIESCECDQFENHVRAVIGLPLGSSLMKTQCSWMLNILGRTKIDANGLEVDDHTFDTVENAYGVPGASVHKYGKEEIRRGRKLAHVTITASSWEQLKNRIKQLLKDKHEKYTKAIASPRVGIVMGSDSDLPHMEAAALIMEKFGIPYELSIVSAHRTPDRMFAYGKEAILRGLEVIIAGAGGAAHLPGMLASLTSLPVIGVPIQTKSFNGKDSLLSIVQMPRGVPVATVAIGNSLNAGLLAIRILGSKDRILQQIMNEFMISQKDEVIEKVDRLEDQGWKKYLLEYSK